MLIKMYPRLRSTAAYFRVSLRVDTLQLSQIFLAFYASAPLLMVEHPNYQILSARDHSTVRRMLAMTHLVERSMEFEPNTGITSAATT